MLTIHNGLNTRNWRAAAGLPVEAYDKCQLMWSMLENSIWFFMLVKSLKRLCTSTYEWLWLLLGCGGCAYRIGVGVLH